MDLQGELLRGPVGDYQYAALPGGWEDEFLNMTDPGDGIYPNDGGICVNQIWRCASFHDQLYVLSENTMPLLNGPNAGENLKHLRFFEASAVTLRDSTRESVRASFAGPEDYAAVANQQITLAPGWFERRNQYDAPYQEPEALFSHPDILARLACCCLWRGCRHDNNNNNINSGPEADAGGDTGAAENQNAGENNNNNNNINNTSLAVLVPASHCYPPAYVRYCQAVTERIISCVPFALRRYLSFATNPAAADRKSFSLFFTPEETELPSDVHAVMIVPGREYLNELERFDLPREIVEIIREAARDPQRGRRGHILGNVFEELEQYTPLPDLTVGRYQQYKEDQTPVTWERLREFNQELGQAKGQEQRYIIQRMRRRLSRQGLRRVDAIIREDPDALKSAPLQDLPGFLSEYYRVVLALQKQIGPELSGAILQRYGREVTDWTPERLRTCQKWLSKEGAAESPLRMLQLLDEGTLWSFSEHLEKLIREKSEVLSRAFLDSLPEILTPENTEEIIKNLDEVCQQCTQPDSTKCLRRFADRMAVVLENDSLPEEMILDIFRRFPMLREQLDALYRIWETETAERKKRLSVIASFEDRLKQSSESEQAGRLQKNLDRLGPQLRREVSLRDYLRVCEETEHRAWPDIFTHYSEYREALSRFIDQYELGIWLGPRVPWNALFSDLLAYQALTGREDICLWRANKGSPSTLCYKRAVSTALDTVELVRATERGEPTEIDLLSCSYVLYCFDMAGMIRRKVKAALWPKLRRPRNPDGSAYIPDAPGNADNANPETSGGIPEGYDSEADYREAEYAAAEYGLEYLEPLDRDDPESLSDPGRTSRRSRTDRRRTGQIAGQIPLTAKMIAIAVLAGVITAILLTSLVLLRIGRFPVESGAKEPFLEYTQDARNPSSG